VDDNGAARHGRRVDVSKDTSDLEGVGHSHPGSEVPGLCIIMLNYLF